MSNFKILINKKNIYVYILLKRFFFYLKSKLGYPDPPA